MTTTEPYILIGEGTFPDAIEPGTEACTPTGTPSDARLDKPPLRRQRSHAQGSPRVGRVLLPGRKARR